MGGAGDIEAEYGACFVLQRGFFLQRWCSHLPLSLPLSLSSDGIRFSYLDPLFLVSTYFLYN